MAEQEIKGFSWLEDIELEPETLRRVYTTDLFQRTLSHLFGLYGSLWRAVKVDANGYLITVRAGETIEKYDVIEVTASDSESAVYTFNFPEGISATKVVEIHVGQYPVKIRFVPVDETALEQIYHQANSIIMRAIAVKGFRVQNATAGQNAFVRVIGWY